MDHKLVLKDIAAGKFEKIYFLHGEEAYYIDIITNAIVKHAMDDSERDFNQTILYGKDAEILSLVSEAKSFPMMGNRRLVILKEAQDFKAIDELEKYFEQPVDSTIFVINYKYKTFDSRKKVMKAAAKNGLVFKSDKLRDYQLVDWISKYVKDVGYMITPKAAMLLAEFLGTDLSRITNELDKLELLIEKGTTINDVHIEENIGISKDYNVFELQNAVAARDVPKAFTIVDYFSHNPKAASIQQVIPNMFSFFTRLMTIHFMKVKSREAVAAKLKIHPYIAGELTSATKVYNPKKLAANIAVLHEFDLKSKGIENSSTSEGELMKEMIFRLMH